MANAKDRMTEDLKIAMKSGDTQRKDALRFILAAIKQVEIDSRETLSDEKINGILQTEAKKRRDSIEEYRKLGRADDVAKEDYELKLVESYLPPQLTPEELAKEVAAAISEVGATGPKDMGAVMKVLLPRVKDKAPGKLITETVQAQLKK
jgi:uncharacterized protein YqeY